MFFDKVDGRLPVDRELCVYDLRTATRFGDIAAMDLDEKMHCERCGDHRGANVQAGRR